MKRLLLAGGGQAHVFVLRAMAQQQPADVEITLVTPSDRLIYTGMLPGWIAGHYQLSELTIPLAPLLQAAKVRSVQARIAAVDLAQRRARTDLGETIDFDLLSIATGPAPNFDALAGAREHALPLRPLDRFVAAWQQIEAQARSGVDRMRLTIIGAGAGGIEIALAAKFRFPALQVRLVTGDAAILPGHSARARDLAYSALRLRDIQLTEATAARVEAHAVVLADGRRLSSDHTMLMTGAAAESWLHQSGLATDSAGFIAVNEFLRSTSHDFVFAAGDSATMMHAQRPKSGVYAVRAGPPLAANLLAAVTPARFTAYRPQRRALYLLSTGARHAIASWGPFAFSGDWVWRWKNRIDRAYIAKFKHRI